MILRCLNCVHPIFNSSCHCGLCVMRCPDCNGDGVQKTLELIDNDGYMGYVLFPNKKRTLCKTCEGLGKVSIVYRSLKGV